MKFSVSSLLTVALVCATLTLVSCKSLTIGAGSGPTHGHGPPPHAPAHGHRHQHHGLELVYDSGLGVYVVVDFPDHFYFKGRYYRFGELHWEVGVHIDGPWESVSEKTLPPGLRGKAKGKGKPKEHPGRGRGLGLEKDKW